MSGPLSFDKAFYSFSYQLGRRANDLHTLLNTDAVGLQTAVLRLIRSSDFGAFSRMPAFRPRSIISQPIGCRIRASTRKRRLHPALVE